VIAIESFPVFCAYFSGTTFIHVSERSFIIMAPSFDNLTEDNGSDSEEELDVAGSCFNSLVSLYLTALV